MKDSVEEANDEAHESENQDKKRRAINLDRMEEIYDNILDVKRDGAQKDVFEVCNTDSKSKYSRSAAPEGS